MKRMLLLGLGTLLGCSGAESAPPVATSVALPAPAASDSSAPEDDVPGASGSASTTPATLVGDWRSPSCGDRGYVRTLRFEAGGTFSAADLVSPCPPGVACVWSGIVGREGTYLLASDTVSLTVASPPLGPRGAQPLPTQLRFEAGVLTEPGPNGPCVYQRN